ncbi:MAG: hypothetical protein V7776_07310 [Halopseudomonas aestusnigri]
MVGNFNRVTGEALLKQPIQSSIGVYECNASVIVHGASLTDVDQGGLYQTLNQSSCW